VWLPAAIYLGLKIGLIIYGVVIISSVDNIIKPLVIGERTKLPTIFLFFGILGGLQAYGFLGVFLGPVVLATIMAFVKIYRQEYAHEHEIVASRPLPQGEAPELAVIEHRASQQAKTTP
jgi:predicted PurR-regulated permease PerM